MTDLGSTIAPKSDQLNSDDLISGPRTVKITAVAGRPGSPEQPIAISFEGDNGKPFLPCKSMRRVLVHVWGKDGAQYPGRSLTLYRDPTVKFGGLEVGGIRISHMSDIDGPMTMALTASKQSRKPFTVRPLEVVKPDEDIAAQAKIEAGKGTDHFRAWFKGITPASRAALKPIMTELQAAAKQFDDANSGDNKETTTNG